MTACNRQEHFRPSYTPVPVWTTCQQMAQSQTKEGSGLYPTQDGVKSPVLPDRRHSTDGSSVPGSRSAGSGSAGSESAGSGSAGSGSAPGASGGVPSRFHPYRRQFSDGAVSNAPYFNCFQGLKSIDVCPATPSSSQEPRVTWDQCNGSFLDYRFMGTQYKYAELPATPVEPPCYLSQSQASYRALGPQFSSRVHSMNGHSNNSKSSGMECISLSTNQHATCQSLFPKPIYSYSILIFMALKNSKTGSLPVSEIYNFMTENFPYFKTAPDGWKNSVRHNLSLNKCFEKVENKVGNSSRKGCLWALNPTKVEKMQEELHKWRRKDPVTVRKSMAKPEDLEHLLGDKLEKIGSLLPYQRHPSSSKHSPVFHKATLTFHASKLPEPGLPIPRPHYSHISSPPQHCGYLPYAATHASTLHPLYSPCVHQPPPGPPSTVGGLNPLLAAKTPPAYSAPIHADDGIVPRSVQEVFMEDAGYDVDTLNPSLTDLQLQGYLWEELREDSMVPDLLASITSTPSPTCTLPINYIQTCNRQTLASVNQTSEAMVGSGTDFDQHINGLYPVVYPGVESLAGYLTSCTAPISLL